MEEMLTIPSSCEDSSSSRYEGLRMLLGLVSLSVAIVALNQASRLAWATHQVGHHLFESINWHLIALSLPTQP
jgi:hypothetical protein